jgi:hypothetical protein
VGCPGCGARAVGPPLARPEHELPSYGHAFAVTASGALLLAIFLASTAAALYAQDTFSPGFWTVVAAVETAAWKLKFLALPFALLAVWMSVSLCRTIRREPQRFIGARLAHAGLASSALVALLIVTFIGVTVPERLRQRQRGIDAGIYAEGYTIQRALLEYRARYGTYPTDMKDLRERLPDTDGRLAAALDAVDVRGYTPRADLASALPKAKTRRGRPAAIRRAALDGNTDDGLDEKVSFTNYELRLPGEDKMLGTEDDWLMRDGVILKPSAFKQDVEREPQQLIRKVD